MSMINCPNCTLLQSESSRACPACSLRKPGDVLARRQNEIALRNELCNATQKLEAWKAHCESQKTASGTKRKSSSKSSSPLVPHGDAESVRGASSSKKKKQQKKSKPTNKDDSDKENRYGYEQMDESDDDDYQLKTTKKSKSKKKKTVAASSTSRAKPNQKAVKAQSTIDQKKKPGVRGKGKNNREKDLTIEPAFTTLKENNLTTDIGFSKKDINLQVQVQLTGILDTSIKNTGKVTFSLLENKSRIPITDLCWVVDRVIAILAELALVKPEMQLQSLDDILNNGITKWHSFMSISPEVISTVLPRFNKEVVPLRGRKKSLKLPTDAAFLEQRKKEITTRKGDFPPFDKKRRISLIKQIIDTFKVSIEERDRSKSKKSFIPVSKSKTSSDIAEENINEALKSGKPDGLVLAYNPFALLG